MTTTRTDTAKPAAAARHPLAGTRRVAPTGAAPPPEWCLHLFLATARHEDAGVCLGNLLHTEAAGGGSPVPAPITGLGAHHKNEQTPRTSVAERFHALVDSVIDPARTDAENRTALLLFRYTREPEAHRTPHLDHVVVWVLAPADLPRFERLATFAAEFLHRTSAPTCAPKAVPFAFTVGEVAQPGFPPARRPSESEAARGAAPGAWARAGTTRRLPPPSGPPAP
ncbi:hypothetical protein OG948_59500 (plasmid) [Embleya sp. NBC_00888]|uniref:hypothetical protein n=1 Tax=Embleya sp. NBC_00888 TaxID=2975960 RepID=UPI002F917CE3|nr:hypothetical protein OG948_59500 [Embleya sp. NBC_00888]